jgi:hypothetical protein
MRGSWDSVGLLVIDFSEPGKDAILPQLRLLRGGLHKNTVSMYNIGW